MLKLCVKCESTSQQKEKMKMKIRRQNRIFVESLQSTLLVKQKQLAKTVY